MDNTSPERQEKEMGKKDEEQTVLLGLWVWVSTCRRDPLHYFLRRIFWISRLLSACSTVQARASMWEDAAGGDGVGGPDRFCSAVAGCQVRTHLEVRHLNRRCHGPALPQPRCYHLCSCADAGAHDTVSSFGKPGWPQVDTWWFQPAELPVFLLTCPSASWHKKEGGLSGRQRKGKTRNWLG